MINKQCSIITDSEGFFGVVKAIDENFVHVQIDSVMMLVPLLRIKSIAYGVESDLEERKTKRKKRIVSEPVEEVPEAPSVKKHKFIVKGSDEDNPFLDSIKKKLEESGLETKLANLNVSVQPEVSDDPPEYHQLKKQNLNEFIPNKKLK